MHNVPRGSETHFKVVMVAEAFEGVPLIKASVRPPIYSVTVIILKSSSIHSVLYSVLLYFYSHFFLQ